MPVGAMAPGMLSTVKAESEVLVCCLPAGAKADAEEARRAMAAEIFIVFLFVSAVQALSCWNCEVMEGDCDSIPLPLVNKSKFGDSSSSQGVSEYEWLPEE